MTEVPMDNCNSCNQDYAIAKENARLYLFIKTAEMAFIFANCPHCDFYTRIFVSQDTVCTLLEPLPILIFPEATEEIVEAYYKLFPAAARKPEPPKETLYHDDSPGELPDIPPQLRRELWDFLREFGKDN
jgi:hypothetical protein